MATRRRLIWRPFRRSDSDRRTFEHAPFLLRRRPYLRQSSPAGGGEAALASRRHNDGAACAFLAEYDWIRTGLMFEPRGRRDVGFDPLPADATTATSPSSSSRRRAADVRPRHHRRGDLRLEQGLVTEDARRAQARHRRALSLPSTGRSATMSSAHHQCRLVPPCEAPVRCPGLGRSQSRRLWRQFHAIVDPQQNYRDMADRSAGDLIAWSPVVRRRWTKYSRASKTPTSTACRTLWTGAPRHPEPTRATRCSTATRRSTVRRAAPGPRRGWRSSTPRAG